MKGLAYDVFDARRLIVFGGVIAAGLAAWFGSTVFDLARPFGFQDPDSESSRAYDLLEDGPAVTRELAALCRAVPLGGRQVHDANIVATLLAHGETQLLTSNAADFARFAPRIEVVVP